MSLSLATRTSRILSSTHRLKSITAQLQPRTIISRDYARKMSSLPKTMSGVIIEKTGGAEVLQWKTDLPVPTPKEGEVLVKNEFIGINFIDTFVSPSLPLFTIRGFEKKS
jgi:hypothetical protein